jgi:hypothetical protein
MSYYLHLTLVVLAALAATSDIHAAAKSAHRPATHHGRTAPRHVSHTKTNRYRKPSVHRRPIPRMRHRVNRVMNRPRIRTGVSTVRRYTAHRLYRGLVRRPYFFGRNPYYYHRYTYSYYPGRYNWRTSYYNRGYRRSRRQLARSVRGIVEGVRGNANNGTVLVQVLRPSSNRFQYGATVAGANPTRRASSVHRFHVNNSTRYEVLTTPPRAGAFASLHAGEQVLIRTGGNQANTAQIVEVFPRRRK